MFKEIAKSHIDAHQSMRPYTKNRVIDLLFIRLIMRYYYFKTIEAILQTQNGGREAVKDRGKQSPFFSPQDTSNKA